MTVFVDDQVNQPEIPEQDAETTEFSDRRDFLRSLGKWSTAAIAAILLSESSDGGWIDGRGGWLNRRTGGGSWVNRRGY